MTTTVQTSRVSPARSGVWSIVVAAGSGRRFGADKLAMVLGPEGTVLDRSIRGARQCAEGTVVVVRAGDSRVGAPAEHRVRFVAGGSTRSESVRCGLAAVPLAARFVLVHDAARPLAGPEVYGRVIQALAKGAEAVVPAVPLVDTIREVGGGVVDRERLRAVQTPQGFVATVLRAAHEHGGEASDDAALAEAIGAEVVLVDGDVRNLKITRPEDLTIVRAHLDSFDTT